MKPVVEVRNVSKSYIISHQNKPGYNTLKDDIGNIIRTPFSKSKKFDQEQFWALKDISFDINKGEIFGIIGKNGSGKSTLLKILSRIVDPTEGSITMRGRTASLLEVGTGFHPELTGRENVYLNGSMLGMSRQEIKSRFNAIIEFSEIEKFIDTPVKFYSSGMYVRLAFSVAAHLEPDILILDEVLSVGDAGFQAKSLRKITESMEAGRTVIFVSHGMDSVQKLCTRGILLNEGQIEFIGQTDALVERYKEIVKPEQYDKESMRSSWENNGSLKAGSFLPHKTYITDESGNKVTGPVKNNSDHFFNVELEVKEEGLLTIGYTIHNEYGSVMYVSANTDMPKSATYQLSRGKQKLITKIPRHLLNEGAYTVSLFGGRHKELIWVIEPESKLAAISFVIRGGLSDSPTWPEKRSGHIAPMLEWKTVK